MKKFFSIGEAAKTAGMTRETLRHYDRIGLVKPSKKDEWTNYRYYTEQDIVRLNTVNALKQMDLPLQEIKRVLEYDDLEKIIDFLSAAEKKADEKIAALRYSKKKIQTAKSDYESKLQRQRRVEEVTVKYFPRRVIMLSQHLETPTLDNLWNYLSHFYGQIEPSRREQFAFEDLAGVYTEAGVSRLFAVCSRYGAVDGLRILPEGSYLCADCGEQDWEQTQAHLLRMVREHSGQEPAFILRQVMITGILQWSYQIQVLWPAEQAPAFPQENLD